MMGKTCVSCNVELKCMNDYEIRNYDSIEDSAHTFIGWCLCACKKLPGIFGRLRTVKIVPKPYICPVCHKVEMFVSDSDYKEMEEFDKIEGKTKTATAEAVLGKLVDPDWSTL